MDRETLKAALVAFARSVVERAGGAPAELHLEQQAEEFLKGDFEAPGSRDARQEMVTRPMPRLELDSLKRDSAKPPAFKSHSGRRPKPPPVPETEGPSHHGGAHCEDPDCPQLPAFLKERASKAAPRK